MKPRYPNLPIIRHFSLFFNLILILVVAGCSSGGTQSAPPQTPLAGSTAQVTTPGPISIQPLSKAVISFIVEVPAGQGPQNISLDLLDEVTGLALNPTRYRMTAQDDRHFKVDLPVPMGSVIKYRYSQMQNLPVVEYTSDAKPVRYRLYYVSGPGLVSDIVCAWNDLPYSGPTGRISGKVLSADQKAPLPDILVEAGGKQTLTASDGSYYLQGLVPGQHHLVFYAMDGAYQPVQQDAVVAAESTTPADLSMAPAPLIKVTFNLTVPQEAINVPVRIAGNMLQLGNTYSDLSGGVSGMAVRMPVMSPDAQGKITATLSLPAGADLEYKYTLGDGFWNAEHTHDGQFKVRQLIVPSKDTVIDDTVETWKSGSPAMVTFNVEVPASTPATDEISIQFNPFTWMEPIPMWSLGSNRWMYILFSPIDKFSAMSYRYCRNEQCGSADDAATIGANPKGWPLTPGAVPQTFNDQVKAWNGWQPDGKPTTVASAAIKPRDKPFMAGVEFAANYDPSWQPKYLQVLQDLHSSGSNWVILSPTWSFTSANPPVLEQVPGLDPLRYDLVETAGQARAIGLKPALFPKPHFTQPVADWWKSAPRNFSWWQAWFERYRVFILDNADLATKINAEALVIGGDWLSPALPDGKLADGSPSGVPGDVEARWRGLLTEVRASYKGPLVWALTYPEGIKTPPPFLDGIDKIYLLYSAPLSSKNNPSEDELQTVLAAKLDQDIYPWVNPLKKPIVIGIDYPSINGGASGLDQSGQDAPSTTLDLQSQVDIYNAFMAVVSQRDWISGFFSRGYYPPAALQDKSGSLHGKPAFDVLVYWFSALKLNK